MTIPLTIEPIPAVIRPKRMIGEFYADITFEEGAVDELQITQHPVQQGASISDHAFVKPATLSIKAAFFNDSSNLSEIYRKLLILQSSCIPLDVVTGKRAYKNMLIQMLRQTTDKNSENILSVDFELKEILLTTVELVIVPERSQQKIPSRTDMVRNMGMKALKDASNSISSSLVNRIIGGK